jgi:hypothetical protein
MPIEIRELQIRSRVDGSAHAASGRCAAEEMGAADARQLERYRETVLAECKALIDAALRERQER